MINELHGLAETLQSKGISPQDWHGEYKPIPNVTKKTPCIRIWIAEDGTVSDYESISPELAQLLRKYGNKQGSFPAFNIVPLYRITDASIISCLDELKKGNIKPNVEKIRKWCKNSNWKSNNIGKINRCLYNKPKELLGIIGVSEDCKNDVVSKLASLVLDFSKESSKPSEVLREALEKCIFTKLQMNEDVGISLSMLFHIGDEKKTPTKDEGSNISVILDVQDWERYNYPVASEHTTIWLNNTLLAIHKNENVDFASNVDAFGTYFVNPNKKMDGVKLSSFEVILRSMFKEKLCQYRYKRIEDGSYPIAETNRSLIKSSLEWVSDIEREGITWRKVDNNEIVFIYPSKLPEIPLKFASIFGYRLNKNVAATENRFENVAKEFIKTLNGIPTNQIPDSIQVFTLRKIDNGRSKIIFTHNTSPKQLANSAKGWECGCHNLPHMPIEVQIVPYPLQIAKIINNVWKYDGTLAQGKTTVKRMKYYQGIELMLDILQKGMVQNFLHILLINSSGLINNIGNLIHYGESSEKNNTKKKVNQLKKESILIFSTIGLLLYKCDERKENYMENRAYLVGQLLHISDELHALYCKVVRNGDIPPQLAGSSMFVTARETPNIAISQLSVRINPYIMWAKQYRYRNEDEKGKESWRANWYLSLFETTANKLNQVITDVTRFNDYEKAQFFIGYLASFPKKEALGTIVNSENKGGTDNE